MVQFILILLISTLSSKAHANEGIGLVLLHALQRVDDQPQISFMCGSHKQNTAFSLTYYPSSGHTEFYRSTGDHYQGCAPVRDQQEILEKSVAIKADLDRAIQSASHCYGPMDKISIELVFPVDHRSIKPTLIEKLKNFLSIDAHADPARSGQAEVRIHRYSANRSEVIDEYLLPNAP